MGFEMRCLNVVSPNGLQEKKIVGSKLQEKLKIKNRRDIENFLLIPITNVIWILT